MKITRKVSGYTATVQYDAVTTVPGWIVDRKLAKLRVTLTAGIGRHGYYLDLSCNREGVTFRFSFDKAQTLVTGGSSLWIQDMDYAMNLITEAERLIGLQVEQHENVSLGLVKKSRTLSNPGWDASEFKARLHAWHKGEAK